MSAQTDIEMPDINEPVREPVGSRSGLGRTFEPPVAGGGWP